MKPALLSLRILSFINLVLAPIVMVSALFSPNVYLVLFAGSLIAVFGFFFHMIRDGLINEEYWAWVCGLIVSGMYLFSIFFPLGLMGLIGLLNRETRRTFNRIDEEGEMC